MKDHPFINIQDIGEILDEMEHDSKYRTEGCYVRETPQSPKVLVSFKERHLFYLRKHPKLNPDHYLANLRTMLRIRSS